LEEENSLFNERIILFHEEKNKTNYEVGTIVFRSGPVQNPGSRF
jgi:hypothetical protein